MRTLGAVRFLLPVLVGALAVGASPAAAATPSPSPSPPCGKPTAFQIEVQPERVAAGDTVIVRGVYRDLCMGETSWPSQTIALRAGTLRETHLLQVARTTTDSQGNFSFNYVVSESSQFQAEHVDTQQVTVRRTAAVDRVSGSCANVLTLAAPTKAAVAGRVQVTGTAPDTSTVNILFRKRGQSTFQVRRTITPGSDGAFSTTFVADDDYRLYAAGDRCDSPPVLVQAQPVISGPAVVRPGTTVTLVLRAPAGVPVKVYFHREGTTGYALRRTGTTDAAGRYTTTYVADADYRYYAITGPGTRASNYGLTQTR